MPPDSDAGRLAGPCPRSYPRRGTVELNTGFPLHRGLAGQFEQLAAEQDLLVQNSWKAVPLLDLARSQLAHFSDLMGDRISLVGSAISLTPDAARALGMTLHELATNAAKYGALSNETGRIELKWSVRLEPDLNNEFTLAWIERDGPPVTKPERRGFGTRVTKEMVELATGGEVSIEYEPEGLTWRLVCSENKICT